MRDAIANAEVGDDVYGEDPCVNRLQEAAARLLGKEDALFVPSGTMGNQISVAVWTRPGDVVLAGENAHALLYESGGAADVHRSVIAGFLQYFGQPERDLPMTRFAIDDIERQGGPSSAWHCCGHVRRGRH